MKAKNNNKNKKRETTDVDRLQEAIQSASARWLKQVKSLASRNAPPVSPRAMSCNEWKHLIHKEQMLRKQLHDSVVQVHDSVGRNGKANYDCLLKWWRVVADIFKQLLNPLGTPRNPQPMELFALMHSLAGYLSVGEVPDVIKHVSGRGRRGHGPHELRHIRLAVTYRAAVSNGIVSDRSPNKTIVEAYGLASKRTAQKWGEIYKPFDLDPYRHSPQKLVKQMKMAGEYYSVAGRSESAVRHRNAKRTNDH